MKKIGIILSSTDCGKHLYNTVSELAKSNKVQLFFLLNKDITAEQGLWQKMCFIIKTRGLHQFINRAVFFLVKNAELKFSSIYFKNTKESKQVFNIKEFSKNDITYLEPVFSNSGLIVRYRKEDTEKIKSLNLDIIIKGNAEGIFQGEILKAAKEGIISFHRGDNRWNRGGPTAFWEVYLREPSTGFVIQILSEELDGGPVIFRGNIQTCDLFTQNSIKLYNESNPYLAKIILDYATSGKLPSPEEKVPFGEPLLTVPTIIQSINYCFKTGLLYFLKGMNFLLFRHYRWGVAFCAGSWRNAVLRKGIKIKNPPNRFFADPFVMIKNERSVCYVEDYSYKRKKGCITAIEIIDNKNYKILGPVIEEPFHMSFPFLFTYNQELFMVPDAMESKSIRLYKCVDFPLKWEFQKNILSNCSALDSMVFQHEQRWWLLTNMATNGNIDTDSKLFAYYSNNPLSDEWIAHDLNPLIFDSTRARNGGILDIENQFPVRVRQKQGFGSYGRGMTLARITAITPSSFSELEIGQISANYFPKIKGCHHIHSNGKYTVYDYVRIETYK